MWGHEDCSKFAENNLGTRIERKPAHREQQQQQQPRDLLLTSHAAVPWLTTMMTSLAGFADFCTTLATRLAAPTEAPADGLGQHMYKMQGKKYDVRHLARLAAQNRRHDARSVEAGQSRANG